MRRQLAISAALALVGMLWGAATAESAHGEVDVRIAARRLDDGRTEFALQQRGADGLWRERLLPAARFFPPETPVGHWLSSSALAIGITGMLEGPDGPSGSVELRIAAQRLQGGRMEFALHRRHSSGRWSERVLPDARFLPAVPESGSWLSSSELAVSTSAREPDPQHPECTPEAGRVPGLGQRRPGTGRPQPGDGLLYRERGVADRRARRPRGAIRPARKRLDGYHRHRHGPPRR